jgi:hypothetical protein
VSRMESARSPWRTLRPLLLAGAAATAWLALSAPAANAESTPDSGSLFGTISSSVSSVAGTAATPVNDTLAPVWPAVAGPPAQPAAPEPAGPLQPLTGAATGTVDYFIDAVPAVNQIVPSGTSGTVTSPVIAAADTIVAEAAHAVLPAAGDALPVLEPVLEPVDELLTDTGTLPLHLPGSEALAPGLADVTDSSAFDGGFGTAAGPAPGVQLSAIPLIYRLSLTPESTLSLPVANLGSARTSAAPAWNPESPGNGDGTAGPHELPAVPGSGSATSQSSGAGPGGPAWLSAFHLDVPLTGVFPVSGPLQNSPAPVSFDPGSSPD